MSYSERLALGAFARAQRHRCAGCNPRGVGRRNVEDDVERAEISDLDDLLSWVHRRAKWGVELGHDPGDRRAQSRQLRRPAGQGRGGTSLSKLRRRQVGVLGRNYSRLSEPPGSLVVAFGRDESRLRALRGRHEWGLFQGDERSPRAHLLPLRNVHRGNARGRGRTE